MRSGVTVSVAGDLRRLDYQQTAALHKADVHTLLGANIHDASDFRVEPSRELAPGHYITVVWLGEPKTAPSINLFSRQPLVTEDGPELVQPQQAEGAAQ